MTFVLDEMANVPQTHAILIGIGSYPHLLGGSGFPAPDAFGLKQLSSPPVSVRAFADWLLTDFNPDAPLGSLSLLIAEGNTPVRYKNPRDGREFEIAVPTMENLVKAIQDWKDRANECECHDNIALFYYCGHGLARGEAETALLASDFGDPDWRGGVMKNAIDFDALVLGMEGCKARRQCYLIDACRNEPRKLLELNSMGDRHILDPRITTSFDQDRNYKIVYATARNKCAYAIRNSVSRFTEALLCALNGAGSDDSTGQWVVRTPRLSEAISDYLRLGNRRKDVNKQEAKASGQDSGFDFHHVNGLPRVPVAITCEPNGANARAELSVRGNHTNLSFPPDADGWQFELLAENNPYDLDMQFADGSFPATKSSLTVRPTHRNMKIKVQRS